ncbi:MAG: hypothetical protein HYY06_27205 [Deltaproteobacteria bacterium]|nr:hypothetical protein [Deltaproteobacteria bacterium]
MEETRDELGTSAPGTQLSHVTGCVGSALRARPYASLALAAAGGFVVGGKLLGQLVRGLFRLVAPMVVDVLVGIIESRRSQGDARTEPGQELTADDRQRRGE